MKSAQTDPICYGLTRGYDWQQEWYEAASRHAAVRARQLRQLGFLVSVSSMGYQVTSVGTVRMSLLNVVAIPDDVELPDVTVERM